MGRNVVASYIRRKLRSWLGVVDPPPPPATIEGEAKSQGISIASALLARTGEKGMVRRKVEPPALFPGVLPPHMPADDPGGLGKYLAADSAELAPMYSWANQAYCGLGFPGYAYLAELSQRSEYRAASEVIAQEMCREWIEFTVQGKKSKKKSEIRKPQEVEDVDAPVDDATPGSGESTARERMVAQREARPADPDVEAQVDDETQEKLEMIEEAFEQFGIREQFQKIAEIDGLFGRAQLFIDIDSTVDANEVAQLPLLVDKETIKKGSLKGFKVIEPIWTTPFTYNADNPTRDDFYVPRAWFVLGRRVHATRLLTFVSRAVPDILKPAYNFGGISMTQLMEPYVFQWLRTRNSVSDLIHNFSVMCLKTDMTNVLAGKDDGSDAQGSILARAKLFTQSRDNQGLTLLDMKREEMVMLNVPLSGLDALQAQAQEHMAAPTHIPLVKLLGITPQGLNASSEGEIKVFYDYVRAFQQLLFGKHLNTVLQIIQLHLFGEVDDSISFEFIPLSSPTVKELAEIRKADAETAATYIDKGVIAPEEVRNKISADPASGYNNLTGDPPDPPQLVDHELGEETATTAHARSEESAEAAHARQLEADKAQQKAAA